MIYAYDLAMQMPVVDLYDTQMMAMAINAAKDVYDKNLDSIKELRKQTGDFWSPTQSHMDFYNKEFNVGQFLDSMYEQGIDPLRSKEGQMLVQRYINSRPYAKLNNMKKSAEAYELYEKNKALLAKENRFNQAFEDYVTGGKNIRDLGVDEVWDRISPIQYQDLNEYAGHIFDKMDDSFIGTDKDTGLDWYGVSRDRRAEALTSQLGGLLSSPLGLFHYEQSRKNAEAILNRKATEAEVLNQFKNDILTATSEYEHKNFKENAEYKRQREWEYDKKKAALEHSYRMREKNAGSGGGAGNGSGDKSGNTTSYGQTLLERGVANWAGSSDPGKSGIQLAKLLGDQVKKLPLGTRTAPFINFYTMNDAESTTAWVNRFSGDSSRTKDAPTGGINYVPTYDKNKLYSDTDLTYRTLGYPGKPSKRNTGKIISNGKEVDIPDDAAMIPTGRVYTAPMRDGTYSQFIEVNVGNSDVNGKLWYKVAETEPVYVENDSVYSPTGYSMIPSLGTVNQWSIQDTNLNKAAGLGQGPFKQATGYFLDNIPR